MTPKKQQTPQDEQQNQSAEQLLIDELNKQIEQLESQIKVLESEKTDQEETAKRAQYDYINLKMDFDRKQRQLDEEKATMKQTSLIDSIKKILPFVETMRKSLDTLTDEQKDSPLAQWLSLTYKNFLSTLAEMHIEPIDALGLEPDTILHEPVGAQPVEDETLKGKVIQEFERGFVYRHDGQQIVIATSKVVIGQ